MTIQAERVRYLKKGAASPGDYVLYWMQASQRASWNHALEYAVERANELRLPLAVLFVLMDAYPGANLRHYPFMLEGLLETRDSLSARGIPLVVRAGSPGKVVLDACRKAALLVTDAGYLRHQRRWRSYIAGRAPCPVVQVESELVVPVETASAKEEYSAATFRPKILRVLDRFLVPLASRDLARQDPDLDLEGMDISEPYAALERISPARAPLPARLPVGGTSEAETLLRSFIEKKLHRYHELSGRPDLEYTSGLSPYLHFGQVSPLKVALEVRKHGGSGADAFLEQLIVRRELSANFVHYNPRYDTLDALPSWALSTLNEHAKDKRDYVYSFRELEGARTHDPYWNAAQMEMLATGRMHNRMRMYWGKKIIEWSPTPEAALRAALRLNDRYQLDGRDPNGYAGVLWCFGKHDRPFAERRVLGKVRYMSEEGLRRKFDVDAYLRRVEELRREYPAPRKPRSGPSAAGLARGFSDP